jgi:DNA-binding YbaB/EbfC family protein
MNGGPSQKDLMRKLQQMQDKMLEEQKALEEETVEASVGGGAVRILMNGHQKVMDVEVAASLLDPAEGEMLQELLIAAFNDAVEKSQALAAQRMGSVTGGLGLPGGLGF